MSVVSILTEEHILFLRFIGQISWETPRSGEKCSRVRGSLLTLFSALKRHDELHELIFDAEGAGPAERERLAGLFIVERKCHADFRDEILDAMKCSRQSPCRGLIDLVGGLTARMRAHFRWEEENLWPCYRASDSPVAELELERRARLVLDQLRTEVVARGVWLNDSSGRGPDVRARS